MHEYASIHNFKQRVSGVRVGVQNFTITSLMIKLSRGSGPKYISEFSFQILSMRKLYLRQKSQNYQPSENHTFHTFFRNISPAVITLSQLSVNCIFLHSHFLQYAVITFSTKHIYIFFSVWQLHFIHYAVIIFSPLRGNYFFFIMQLLHFIHCAVFTFSSLCGNFIFLHYATITLSLLGGNYIMSITQ